MSTTTFQPGDVIRFQNTGIPTVDGRKGSIAVVMDGCWAHVRTDATATGRLRVPFEEMVLESRLSTGYVCAKCGGSNLFRSGACMTCADCGESGGCG